MKLKYIKSTYERWRLTKQPVGGLLPGIVEGSLSQQSTTELLTSYIDKELVNLLDTLLKYREIFDPNITEDRWLDLLAIPCGFVDDYWEKEWTPKQKRWMLINSYSFIWVSRGTREVLEAILRNFDIPFAIWTDRILRVPIEVPAVNGNPRLRFFIQLPITIGRDTYEWNLADKLTRQYSMVGVQKKVTYDYFRAGYSRADDPVFRYNPTVYLDDGDENTPFVPQSPKEELTGGVPLVNENNRIYIE